MFLEGIVSKKQLFQDMKGLPWNKKALIHNRVVNRRAHWNICFADHSQEPDIANGKGTIINFENVPSINKIRKTLPNFLGPKAENMFAESNYYYDVSKCSLGKNFILHLPKKNLTFC